MKPSIDFIPSLLQDKESTQIFCETLDFLRAELDVELETINYKHTVLPFPLQYQPLIGVLNEQDETTSKEEYVDAYFDAYVTEIGLGYMLPLFNTPELKQALAAFIPILQYFKGHRIGVEIILDLAIGKHNWTMTEWWEEFDSVSDAILEVEKPEPSVFPPSVDLIIDSNVGGSALADLFAILKEVLENYCYAVFVLELNSNLIVELGAGIVGQEYVDGIGDYTKSSRDSTYANLVSNVVLIPPQE